MELKFAVLFIVFALAGVSNGCGERKVGECVERMLINIMGFTTYEEACDEMRLVADCFRNAADECLGEDRDPEINKVLEELDTLLEKNCPAKEREKDEIDRCLDENQQYLMQCIPESMVKVDELLEELNEVDMGVKKCALYKLLYNCMLDRIAEKCGEAARQKAMDEMDRMSLSARDACAAQETFFSARLLDRKKK